jgi:hypothetical protein
VHSQKQSESSLATRALTTVERDSIFIKIQRGKVNADKVLILEKSLAECARTKKVYVKVIQVHNMKADSLSLINKKRQVINENLVDINKAQAKEYRKRTFKSFIKGGIVGIILTLVGIAIAPL